MRREGYAALAYDLHCGAKVVEDLIVSIARLDCLYANPSKTRPLATGGIKAVVGVHSGFATVSALSAPGAVRARILECIGGDDPVTLPEQRKALEEEMRRGAADWHNYIYGNTVNVFMNPGAANAKRPEAFRYNPASDVRS